MKNNYIDIYLDMLNNNYISKNPKQLIIEEKRKSVKQRLILEASYEQTFIAFYAKETNEIRTDDDTIKNKIKNSNQNILQEFGIKDKEHKKIAPKAVDILFEKLPEDIKKLIQSKNIIFYNKDTKKVFYSEPNKKFSVKNDKDLDAEYNKNKNLQTLYTIKNDILLSNKEKVNKSNNLSKFRYKICKDEYIKLFSEKNKLFEQHYTKSFREKLDIFGIFTNNFIFNNDVNIYQFSENTIIKSEIRFQKGKNITEFKKQIKNIMQNNGNIIYHIQSIRDLLNSIIIKDADLSKQTKLYQNYKKFNNMIRKPIVQWIEKIMTSYKDCSIKLFDENYNKIEAPAFKLQQLDYNKKAKQIINGFKNYRKKNKTQFQGISEANQALYNDILYVLGQKNIPQKNEKLKPYNTLLTKGENITPEDYHQLDELKTEFIQALKVSKFQEFTNDVTEQQVNNASINMTPEQQTEYINRMTEQQKKKCKALGFRTKKQAAGFAALFENLLEGLFSMFGAGSEKKTAANYSQISSNMKFVNSLIKNHTLQPGQEYPVYFDIKDINKEFEPYLNKSKTQNSKK